MIDLHNHMLPGLDDGALNWEQSLAMGRMAVEDGIQEIVCTPHWVNGYFENRRETIVRRVETLQEKLNAAKIPLKVYPGAELHLDFDISDKIKSGELITLNDMGRFALIELPVDIVPRNMKHFFWNLQTSDITPIISHPERNNALRRHPSRLFRWVQRGALTQLTAASLLGRFGTEVRKFAVSLLEHRMVHVIGTDAHGTEDRIPQLSEGYREAEKIVGRETAHQMVFENPQRILRGESIHTHDPIPYLNRSAPSRFKKFAFFLGFGGRTTPS
jgi:protein-tyrosine phosphatase